MKYRLEYQLDGVHDRIHVENIDDISTATKKASALDNMRDKDQRWIKPPTVYAIDESGALKMDDKKPNVNVSPPKRQKPHKRVA